MAELTRMGYAGTIARIDLSTGNAVSEGLMLDTVEKRVGSAWARSTSMRKPLRGGVVRELWDKRDGNSLEIFMLTRRQNSKLWRQLCKELAIEMKIRGYCI